jgi:CubicO group peptidase (beta-lactamase class C family)
MSVIALIFMAPPISADELPGRLPAGLSQSIERVLGSTGVTGLPVSIVEGGAVVLARAYGAARLEPEVTADPEQRFPIDSITKHFTAAAPLLLQEQ